MNRTHRNLNTAKAPNKKSQIPAEAPSPRTNPKAPAQQQHGDTETTQHVHEKSPQETFTQKWKRQSMHHWIELKRVKQTRNQKEATQNNFMKQKAIKADYVRENVATSIDDLNWHRVKEERRERTRRK